MHHTSEILLTLFIAYLAAIIFGEIAQRLKMPSVVGEIVAGCVIGPSLLGWITISEPLELFSEMGAVLLLFSVGLETRIGELKKVGKEAVLVGILGVILPFLFGGAWAYWMGFPSAKAMFVAAAFVATSAGITARVLQELGVLERKEARVILGAAVIDDILAMLLLGVVSSLQGIAGVNVGGLLFTLALALAFVGLVVFFGGKFMQRKSELLEVPINPLSPLTLSLALCLGLAVAASYIGLAAIIGAFLAGMVMAEAQQQHTLEKQIKPIMEFLVPFFFVVTGAKVALGELSSLSMIGTVLFVTVIATLSKLLACGFGARSLGRRSALIIGFGMVPRGEVGIIVAALGAHAGIFSPSVYAIIIAMALLTAMIAPPVLKRLFAEEVA